MLGVLSNHFFLDVGWVRFFVFLEILYHLFGSFEDTHNLPQVVDSRALVVGVLEGGGVGGPETAIPFDVGVVTVWGEILGFVFVDLMGVLVLGLLEV